MNRSDYARKLYLIENCIYGVDIQPIAIQISKLRFFISLVVDQNTNNDPTDNFGIRPLPNLEAKFVAANTLIGLNKKDASLFDKDTINAKENELKSAKHKIFSAKTVRTKRKWRDRVNKLRQEIADMLKDCGAVGNAEAQQLAGWDMFNQNDSSPFFDSEWMFGVKDGFDIVIGNPPYVLLQNTNIPQGVKDLLLSSYNVAQYKVDLYHLFYEKGLEMLKNGGVLDYITPIAFLKNTYNNKLRQKLISESSILIIIRFFIPVFDASVDNIIFICRKEKTINNVVRYIDIKNNISEIIDKRQYNHYNQELAKSSRLQFSIGRRYR
nr:Eco57I restriction-modification methylase domain-containing protein [Phocaeicola paurosaccharolyticus]